MMTRMNSADDLRLLFASRHPLIVARAEDESRFMGFCPRTEDIAALRAWAEGRATPATAPSPSVATPPS
jgi:hypothetical protein